MLNKGIEADHLLKKDGDITEAHLLTKLFRSLSKCFAIKNKRYM